MTDLEYRQLARIANSDLIELSNLDLSFEPIKKSIKPAVAKFGRDFHTLLLEPEKLPVDELKKRNPVDQLKLIGMQTSFNLKARSLTKYRIANGKNEGVRSWTCPITGLPLKAKLDNLFSKAAFGNYSDRYIIDLKSTSCKEPTEFFDSIIKYKYDRQAAFYLDSVDGGYGFTFVCVQKNQPYNVFEIDMSFSKDRRDIIDEARKKNAFWLKRAKIELEKPDGWRPSSWSRTTDD